MIALYTNNKRLPVPLPQNLRGVSVAHGLGGGTSPHLCVCSEKPRRGFQSSLAPENRDRKSSVRQTLGVSACHKGALWGGWWAVYSEGHNRKFNGRNSMENEEYYWKPCTEHFPFTVCALVLCVLQGLNGWASSAQPMTHFGCHGNSCHANPFSSVHYIWRAVYRF